MARPLRIEFPGALYHVTSRGNARAPIFFSSVDRLLFLDILGTIVEDHLWLCYAYCLMPNHYHLLIETPEANLSRGMRQLNGLFTQRINRRHDRVGHLFQGRFKGILVEREAHLLELARYIVLNPVRASMVDAPEDYRWSSLRATLGLAPAPAWLATRALLEPFGTRGRYREFVWEGVGSHAPWADLRGGLLGSEAFAARMTPLLEGAVRESEIPRRERFAHRQPLDKLFPPDVATDHSRRNSQIRTACSTLGYTYSQVGRHLGLHCATVSRIVRREASHADARSKT